VLLFRILMNMSTIHHVRALWNANYSRGFPVTNGVKQGVVQSNFVLCIY